MTAGEAVGFMAPGLVAPLVWERGAAVALPAMVLAGAVEGSVLGWSQTRVLREVVPGIESGRWVLATGLAGAFAWCVGMLPATGDSWQAWPVAVQVVLGLVLATVLLTSIGVAQWLVLRRHLSRAGRWIGGSVLAWAAGLGVFLVVSTPLWQPGQAPVVVVAIGLVAGALMAVVMALVTGLVLRAMLRSP